MERELARRDQPGQALVTEPQAILDGASVAAAALKGVLDNKAKKVIISGEQYLEYEDWQTVGQFYGYGVTTGDAVPVEIEGVKGAKAVASLLHLRTGLVLGGAEAYCLRDEENWGEKPWFQLASMAQTRAASKALRNRLAWVVVLAGYKPTPAEEMVGTFRELSAATPEKAEKGLCSVHNIPFKHNVGTKRGTGEPYDFWSCPHKTGRDYDCKQKPVQEKVVFPEPNDSSLWVEPPMEQEMSLDAPTNTLSIEAVMQWALEKHSHGIIDVKKALGVKELDQYKGTPEQMQIALAQAWSIELG